MSDLLATFIAECAKAGIPPRAALKAGGVDPSLWKKWEDGKVSPTLRSFEAARAGFRRLQREADRTARSRKAETHGRAA